MAKQKRIVGILSTVPQAFANKGFYKAFIYSFGSFLIGWLITWLALPEISATFGSYAWIIPALNSFLVAIKQYLDALKK